MYVTHAVLFLIPRLLYGKMQRLTGTGSGGRAGVGVRRAVVLRFLASCPQKEIQIFMDLIFAPLKHLCRGKKDLLFIIGFHVGGSVSTRPAQVASFLFLKISILARSLRRTKVKKICSGNHCLTFDFLFQQMMQV